MASTITFLEAVNSVLKRVGVLQGSTGDLTVLTATSGASNTARARDISTTIDLWNEAIQHVYDLAPFAGEVASATFSGVANTREYSLPDDFERMAGDSYDLRIVKAATAQLTLTEYRGGYQQMYADQISATQYSGAPSQWAINPVSGKLRFDTENTATNTATASWNFLYEKRVSTFTSTSTATTAVFPFSNSTVQALIPVVAQFYNAEMKDKFDRRKFQISVSRAVKFLTQTQPSARYGVRYGRSE